MAMHQALQGNALFQRMQRAAEAAAAGSAAVYGRGPANDSPDSAKSARSGVAPAAGGAKTVLAAAAALPNRTASAAPDDAPNNVGLASSRARMPKKRAAGRRHRPLQRLLAGNVVVDDAVRGKKCPEGPEKENSGRAPCASGMSPTRRKMGLRAQSLFVSGCQPTVFCLLLSRRRTRQDAAWRVTGRETGR